MKSPQNGFEGYLQAVSGSGEAGLLIVSGGKNDEAAAMLRKRGFELAETPASFGKLNAALVAKGNQKFWYDIAAQFPGGQLQWTDPDTKEVKSAGIAPSEASLVLVCDESALEDGPDLRTVSGAAFRLIS